MKKILIIAEAGVNHNGDLNLAKKLIEIAAKSGADFVKFQSFKAQSCVSKHAKKAQYQVKTTAKDESQFEMIKRLELNLRAHKILISHAKKCSIAFLSTPFDLESIELLNELGLNIFKIPSGEITNLPYLKRIASLDKKVILSTGMANLGEIEQAIDILCKNGTKRKNITLLHCTSAYPAPFSDLNLRAIQSLKHAFKLDVGYSDHSQGIHISLAAVSLGACMIEKHFTLDKNMLGPDHRASIEPHELKNLCTQIRDIQKALGHGIKRASRSEQGNKAIVRKSLVAKKAIKKGEIFNEQNLTTKRPGNGISALAYDLYMGKKAKKNYEEDELICE